MIKKNNNREFTNSKNSIEDKQESFFELLNDMVGFVSVLDPDGNITFVNNTLLEAVGAKLEDVKGKKCYDAYWWAYSGEVREKIKADISKCAKGEKIIREIQAKVADGSLIWIESNMHPMYDDAGNIRYLVSEGYDITERKQALEDTKQKVAYLDNMPTYMAVTDVAGSLQFTSAVTIKKLGLTLDGLIGTKFDQMVWWEYSKNVQKRMRSVVSDASEGKSSVFEVDIKQGENIVPIKYTCDPLRDENGEIYALLHTGTRIDELRAALDDAGRKVAYVNNAPIPIAAVDKDINILFINKIGASVAGTTPEEAIGKKCYDVFDTPECGTEKCCIEQVVKNGQVVTGETRLRGAKEMDVQITCAPFKDSEGNIAGGVKYITDITDLKRLMEEEKKLSDAIMKLSTPIIQIWDDVLMIPLIGTIDAIRAEQILENLLEAIASTDAEVVIIDLSGIPTVDTEATHQLIKAASAAMMLGSKVIFTGISPDMAQTMTRLGIDLSTLKTRQTLSVGLQEAINIIKK
ncbi:MAG: PAS domain S-box protein [Methanosarcinales archaeon]|nr:MAG: PAS domain S-box protein [Methanosarcinales archaeon]